MSDTDNKTKTADISPPKNTQGSQAPINIMAQYVRDISFENPNAPESLRAGKNAPEMDINIGMDARKIPDDEIENLYETVLNFRAEAKRADETVFILEMQYGATVTLNSIPEENHHPVLLIELPRLMFPYVRQIVSDVTVQGGYPPLILNPVDFQALYMEQFKDQIEEAKKAAKNGASKADQDTEKTDEKA